jgi:hypothetical protein
MVAMSLIKVGEFIGNKVNCRKFFNSFQKCDETIVKFFIIFSIKNFDFDEEYRAISAFLLGPDSLLTVRIVYRFLDYPARRFTPASRMGLSGCPVLLWLFIIQFHIF